MSSSIIFTCNYKQSDFKRTYELTDIDSVSAAVETIRDKVNQINESLESGTATDLENLFVANDYNASQNKGTLARIDNVKLKTITETYIQKTTRTVTSDKIINPDENKLITEDNDNGNID